MIVKFIAYPAATVGNGVFLDNLHSVTDWVFSVRGADATNNLTVNVGNFGDSAKQTVCQLKDCSSGSAVSVISSPGIYKLTVPMPFRDLYITRSGAGSASCTVVALGKSQ